MKNRTNLQAEANRIDMEMYRLIGWIDRLAEDTRDGDLAAIARDLFCRRGEVRKYMHPEDKEKTVG